MADQAVNRRLTIALILALVAPLAVLSWTGWRLSHAEQARVREDFRALAMEELMSERALIANLLQSMQERWVRQLEPDIAKGQSPRPEPAIRSRFALNLESGEFSAIEDFHGGESLDRVLTLVMQGNLARSIRGEENSARDEGWYTWHDANGLGLILWKRGDGDLVWCGEISRGLLLSEMIAALPATDPDNRMQRGFRLLNEEGQPLYVWGQGNWERNGSIERLSLPEPLQGWSIDMAMPELGALSRPTVLYLVGVSILGLMLLLAAVGFLIHREATREIREAARRMNFVSQVSHELKTPLTNIRMYAELLAESLDENDTGTSKRAGIIVSESQRLGRLIENVLAFGRDQRGDLRLRVREMVLDDVVRDVAEQFTPSLATAGLQIETDLKAPQTIPADPDAVGQILGNLLGNAEKYASEGKRVSVRTEARADAIYLIVEDYGPGIPSDKRDVVFEPFARLDDSLTARAAGTGIGLTIARTLARLHGGDLRLTEKQGSGCRFELTLPIERGRI